jgi:hypothetical protein
MTEVDGTSPGEERRDPRPLRREGNPRRPGGHPNVTQNPEPNSSVPSPPT